MMKKSVLKTAQVFAACVAMALLVAGALGAQEKAKDEAQFIIPTKVTVVFNEYAGEKEVSSLPYVLRVNAYPQGTHLVSMRMVLHVPILYQDNGQTQIVRLNVGTNLDCNLEPRNDGGFALELSAERDSAYAPQGGKGFTEWHPGDQPLSGQPIFDSLHVDPKLIIRDGQTLEAAMVTNPVSGHVIKIDVTLNVMK